MFWIQFQTRICVCVFLCCCFFLSYCTFLIHVWVCIGCFNWFVAADQCTNCYIHFDKTHQLQCDNALNQLIFIWVFSLKIKINKRCSYIFIQIYFVNIKSIYTTKWNQPVTLYNFQCWIVVIFFPFFFLLKFVLLLFYIV